MDNASIEILGGAIRMKPDKKGNKEVTISLAKAVAKENNCSSINNAQKAGRKLHVSVTKGKGKDIQP